MLRCAAVFWQGYVDLNRAILVTGGGDCKYLQSGVYELRFFFGSGYRVYFAEDKQTIILLLTAGSKATQRKDIVTAISYWQEYQRNDYLQNSR
jgi:putative addiction module killer protein